MTDSSESKFLSGPRPRGSELGFALDVFRELVRGFRVLHFVGPCVTVFGSARFTEEHEYYVLARDIGQRLARVISKAERTGSDRERFGAAKLRPHPSRAWPIDHYTDIQPRAHHGIHRQDPPRRTVQFDRDPPLPDISYTCHDRSHVLPRPPGSAMLRPLTS